MGNRRTPLVAGNWKMNNTVSASERLARGVARSVGGDRVEVAVCPPFTSLAAVSAVLQGSAVALGAQDVHWEDEGAYTGEISPPMLADVGCRYVIVGHSERRHIFGEDDAAVCRKVEAVIRHGMIPILCVGETTDERDAQETEKVVTRQTASAIEGLDAGVAASMVIAYEPVWAIGTGRAADGSDADRVARMIRTIVARVHGEDAGSSVRILYGGSVKPANVGEFACQPEIDGALVGGASLDAGSFAELVAAFERAP